MRVLPNSADAQREARPTEMLACVCAGKPGRARSNEAGRAGYSATMQPEVKPTRECAHSPMNRNTPHYHTRCTAICFFTPRNVCLRIARQLHSKPFGPRRRRGWRRGGISHAGLTLLHLKSVHMCAPAAVCCWRCRSTPLTPARDP